MDAGLAGCRSAQRVSVPNQKFASKIEPPAAPWLRCASSETRSELRRRRVLPESPIRRAFPRALLVRDTSFSRVKKTAVEGLYYWGRYQPDRELDFNGTFWARPDGGVLFDPMELSAVERGVLAAKGGARFAILTNFDHLRATPALKDEFGLAVFAPAEERARFGERADVVDHWYGARGGLPPELEIDVHELRGGKSPVEAALYVRPLQTLLFGDLVRTHASGRLQLLPDAKLTDRARLVEGLRALGALPLRAVVVGDGDSAWFHADAAYAELLASIER